MLTRFMARPPRPSNGEMDDGCYRKLSIDRRCHPAWKARRTSNHDRPSPVSHHHHGERQRASRSSGLARLAFAVIFPSAWGRILSLESVEPSGLQQRYQPLPDVGRWRGFQSASSTAYASRAENRAQRPISPRQAGSRRPAHASGLAATFDPQQRPATTCVVLTGRLWPSFRHRGRDVCETDGENLRVHHPCVTFLPEDSATQ